MKKSTLKIVLLILLEIILIIMLFPRKNGGIFFLMSSPMRELTIPLLLLVCIYIPMTIIVNYKKSKTVFNLEDLPEKIDPRFNVLYLELQQKHVAELEKIRKKARFAIFLLYLFGIIMSGVWIYMGIEARKDSQS